MEWSDFLKNHIENNKRSFQTAHRLQPFSGIYAVPGKITWGNLSGFQRWIPWVGGLGGDGGGVSAKMVTCCGEKTSWKFDAWNLKSQQIWGKESRKIILFHPPPFLPLGFKSVNFPGWWYVVIEKNPTQNLAWHWQTKTYVETIKFDVFFTWKWEEEAKFRISGDENFRWSHVQLLHGVDDKINILLMVQKSQGQPPGIA